MPHVVAKAKPDKEQPACITAFRPPVASRAPVQRRQERRKMAEVWVCRQHKGIERRRAETTGQTPHSHVS
jgi:hypothetical protein